jgi:hypothetical protein
MRAVSQRTGWEYEHDETDAQIDAIENLILGIRETEGIKLRDPASKRGATFTWGSSTDEGVGDITIGTSYVVAGEGTVNMRGTTLENSVWKTERWLISPEGEVTELEES